MSEFVIYALAVKQGILGIAPAPGRGGSYEDDLAHLKDWKPAMLISLTQQGELEEIGAGRLGNDVMNSGARWISIPVPDFEIIPKFQEDIWRSASTTARAALDGGGRVLIHCMSGCGRSGMAAMRLMVESGEQANTALKRLRAIRPCAVETDDQLAWARKGRLK